jgi:hypothetical protein
MEWSYMGVSQLNNSSVRLADATGMVVRGHARYSPNLLRPSQLIQRRTRRTGSASQARTLCFSSIQPLPKSLPGHRLTVLPSAITHGRFAPRRKEIIMKVGKDVVRFIFLTEKFQTAFLDGEPLSHDEVLLIRECALELLHAVQAPAEADHSQFLIPF